MYCVQDTYPKWSNTTRVLDTGGSKPASRVELALGGLESESWETVFRTEEPGANNVAAHSPVSDRSTATA